MLSFLKGELDLRGSSWVCVCEEHTRLAPKVLMVANPCFKTRLKAEYVFPKLYLCGRRNDLHSHVSISLETMIFWRFWDRQPTQVSSSHIWRNSLPVRDIYPIRFSFSNANAIRQYKYYCVWLFCVSPAQVSIVLCLMNNASTLWPCVLWKEKWYRSELLSASPALLRWTRRLGV